MTQDAVAHRAGLVATLELAAQDPIVAQLEHEAPRLRIPLELNRFAAARPVQAARLGQPREQICEDGGCNLEHGRGAELKGVPHQVQHPSVGRIRKPVVAQVAASQRLETLAAAAAQVHGEVQLVGHAHQFGIEEVDELGRVIGKRRKLDLGGDRSPAGLGRTPKTGGGCGRWLDDRFDHVFETAQDHRQPGERGILQRAHGVRRQRHGPEVLARLARASNERTVALEHDVVGVDADRDGVAVRPPALARRSAAARGPSPPRCPN